MARARKVTDKLWKVEQSDIEQALESSLLAGSDKDFRSLVDMRNPSRSYYVRYKSQLHSLKAIVTYALRVEDPNTIARDFHASDAAKVLRQMGGLEVVHGIGDETEKAREQRWIEALARPRQAKFRERLFDIYQRCPLSGCSTPFALEAAHVIPVKHGGSDRADNGILLRADLHKLFDGDLIAIDPQSGLVHLATDCQADYGMLLKEARFVPPAGGPKLAAFDARWTSFRASKRAVMTV
jgi:hypothetical protein